GKHVHGADGRKQDFAESVAGGPLSGCLHQHGTRNGKHRAEIRDFARGGGCVCGEFTQESCRGDWGGRVQGRNGGGGSEEYFRAERKCSFVKGQAGKADDADVYVWDG